VTRRAFVHRVATHSPDDVRGVEAMLDARSIEPGAIVAIFGKTEGNGLVNDFTRSLASRALKDLLRRYGADEDVAIVMSGGTEGALSPHFLVLEAREVDEPAKSGALALGRARTKPLPPEQLGRLEQVDSVAEGVREAMRSGGVGSAAAVHFVQVKCPLLTSERVAETTARGAAVATRDTLKSMALSRAASALGVAVALGEIDRAELSEDAIGRDWTLFSSRASASAGVELEDHEIVVLGAGAHWCGPLTIAHCVMRDAVDIEPVRGALGALGLAAPGQLDRGSAARIVALLAKAEASSEGTLRGYRHTMLGDSDISSTRHARAFVAGALAGLIGHAQIFVSGGAEHQGPDGGGPVAIIAARAA
jgi:cyanuric acid amidohydrolase